MQDGKQVRPFGAFLQEQRGGDLHSELSDKLNEVAAAAIEHQKKGTVTLTVEVAPNPDGLTVQVSDKVQCKVPEGERGSALFFVADGNLQRRDPRQMEVGDLREVRGGASEAPTAEHEAVGS